MKPQKVDKAFLSLLMHNRELIKAHMPTEQEVEIIVFIKQRKAITSYDFSKHFSINGCSSSKSLKNLFRKGYLTRKSIAPKVRQGSGLLYEYKCAYQF